FRTEPEGDDIAVVVLEPAHKAQHIAREGQQMSPGNAGPGARRQRCGDHTQSFYGGAVSRTRGRHHGVGAQAVRETGEGRGWPAKGACRLAGSIAVAALRDSGARPATCGVTTTSSHCSSAGSRGGTPGFPSSTSRPAPAIRFARSAASRAWVATTVPRPTL